MRLAAHLALRLGLVAALAAPVLAAAQPAHLVADLDTTQEDITAPLFTGTAGLQVMGGLVYSLQEDGLHGVELWRSDGTAAGTQLVKDICPGGCSAFPRNLTVFGGILYFSADDGVHGQEIWKSDGSAAGTVMVTDLRPGLRGSNPQLLVAGGTLFVSADDGVHGRELWKTDGTAAGTLLVADIAPGAVGSSPRLWAAVGGRLLLDADDGVHGREPWLSDGTTAGTALLADVRPGVGDSSMVYPYYNRENDAVDLGGGSFLFQADDGVHGPEPWISDGTAAGTALLLDIAPGSGGSYAHAFTSFAGKIFFAADDGAHGLELWTTDGTAAGTALFVDLAPGSGNGYPARLTPVGGTLFFAASDGQHGRELWKTDGTLAGTAMVKDVNPSPATDLTTWGFNPYVVPVIEPFDGGVLFFGDDGTHGAEVWRSDGTAAGTFMVDDVATGSGFGVGAGYAGITVAGTVAYFQGMTAAHGAELWKTDGTAAGTVEVADVQAYASSVPVSNGYSFGQFHALGSELLCSATDGVSGVEPWVSDGTAGGTVRLADLAPGSGDGGPQALLSLGTQHLLIADDGGLWTTDGSPAGTSPVVPTSTVAVANGSAAAALGKVLFAGTDGSNDTELWTTDGTPGNTVKIADINATGGSYPGNFTALGSVVIFTASAGAGDELWETGGTAATTGVLATPAATTLLGGFTALPSWVVFTCDVHVPAETGVELCHTDGTPANTGLLADLRGGAASSSPAPLGVVNGKLVLAADDGVHGVEPWVTDGTPGGTALLLDIAANGVSSLPPYPEVPAVTAGGKLFFPADDGVHGTELWRTDGTTGGTAPLRDIFSGARGSDIEQLTAAGPRVYFVADDGVHGRELWVSDGTAVGTHLAADIVSGSGSPVIRDLRAVDGIALFSADDGVHGRELWRSDGMPGGTFLVQDIDPGAGPSNPTDFTAAGASVFFAANDGVTGSEIWAAPKRDLLATFTDVPGDYFAWRFVEAAFLDGLTAGCGPRLFCPEAPVTRAEASVLLLAARGTVPPPPTGTLFGDVPAGYWAGAWIEELAREGITGGCSASPPLFCPGETITRAQMAVWIVTARHETLPGTLHSRFADVPDGYWALPWIEKLAADGISSGCGGGNYCPDATVTRGEMAVFVSVAFHLPLP